MDSFNLPPIPTPDGKMGQAAARAFRERGGCLTILLITIMIANPIIGVVNIAMGLGVGNTIRHGPLVAIGSGLLCFGNAIWAIGLWKWKKWGLYACIVSAVVGFALNFFLVGPAKSSLGLLVCVVLSILVSAKWKDFE